MAEQNPEPQKPTLSWSQPAQNQQPAQPAMQKPLSSVPPVIKDMPKATVMPKQNTAGKNPAAAAGWIVGGVLVIALGAWGLVSLHNKNTQVASVLTGSASSTEENNETSAGSETTNPAANAGSAVVTMSDGSSMAMAGGMLTLASPQDAGSQVTITSAQVTNPTWVAVYENLNGKPGNVLGAALFTAERQSGPIVLLRSTIAGQTYFVGELLDNGDHVFSLKDDKIVLDQNGNPVLQTFQTR